MPAGVELEVVIDSDDDDPAVTDEGENDAPAPDGSPLALSETVWAEPDVTAVDTVALAPLPAVTLAELGLTESEKSFPPVVDGPKAATPFGVPSPVGPSYPLPEVQR